METKVIKREIITEKSTRLKESKNIYVFEVLERASVNSVKEELKRLFNVEPLRINVSVIPGKKRRMYKTNRFARLPKWKKVFVKLKDGQSIDFGKLEKESKKKSQKSQKSKENLEAKKESDNA